MRHALPSRALRLLRGTSPRTAAVCFLVAAAVLASVALGVPGCRINYCSSLELDCEECLSPGMKSSCMSTVALDDEELCKHDDEWGIYRTGECVNPHPLGGMGGTGGAAGGSGGTAGSGGMAGTGGMAGSGGSPGGSNPGGGGASGGMGGAGGAAGGSAGAGG